MTSKFKNSLREKAISKAKTRILIAGRKAEEFTQEELEVIVREEEEEIKNNLKQKGLLAVAAAFGFGLL